MRSVSTLCENLVTLGYDITVYTTNANGSMILPVAPNQPNLINGVEVHYFQRRGRNGYFYSPQLSRACYQHVTEFDLVYVVSNWAFPFMPACHSALVTKVPFVISPRASFKKNTWEGKIVKKLSYHLLIERYLITHAAAIHYTTELEQKDSLWLRLRPPAFVVPNPVNFSEFQQMPAKGLFRAKYAISPTRKVILFLGRVESAKGLDFSLKSFAEIASTNSNVSFVIAGPEEDNYGSVIDKMVGDLKIGDCVLRTGQLDSQSRLEALVDSDVFVLTSYSENFGMSVVEAMAAGVPVVVSDRIGLADLIHSEQIGFVVPLDVDTISCKLRELLDNDEQRRIIGHKAARVVREKFAPLLVAETMNDMFREIVRYSVNRASQK